MILATEVLRTKIEKESESNCKLKEKCPNCGEALYKEYELFGKKRVVKVMCKCKRQEAAEEEKRQEAADKQIRLERLFSNSLMDKKFRSSTFKNWDFSKGDKKMYNLGMQYVNEFKNCKKEALGLLIYGQPGNGKTYLSSCIANKLLKYFIPVICVSTNGLLTRIQETYNKWGKEAEADVIRGLCNASLLIIDDLGTEKPSEWSKSMIYNIIDSRYRSNLPLIITSNLEINPNKTNGILTELYGKRTEERIFEMCIPVFNSAKSIRVEEAKRKTQLLREILNGR